MDIVQLKCPVCGGAELEKLRWNEFRCSYCGSTLRLDSERKRIELAGWVCPECGFKNPMGQRFCSQCGTKLTKACPRCRAENYLDVRYCGSCGFRLDVDKLITFGKTAFERGCYSQARNYYQQVLALDSTNQEARETLADIKAILARKVSFEPKSEVQPTEQKGGSPKQWFKRQSRLGKIVILAGVPLLFICLCASLASVVSPTPQATPTTVADVELIAIEGTAMGWLAPTPALDTPLPPTQPTVEIIPTPTPTMVVGSRTEFTRFQITSTGVQENAPLIFKDLVVYRRHGAPDVDIFGYNLRTREEFPLVQRPGHQSPSGLFESYLVYTEDTGNPIDKNDVRLLNYETGEDIPIAGGPENQSGGGIYGDLVTYISNIGNDGFGDLYVYHIRTGESEFIDSNVARPIIWGHNVVWYYHLGSGHYNIKGYNLQREEFFEISSVNNGYQHTPDINGSYVVWRDGRDGKSAIYEKNLDTGKETLVYEVPSSGKLGRPVIANRYIAWVHGRGTGAHDIFVQNRITGEIIEVSNDGPQQPSPTVPDIWEDTVVWMSWHTGNGDIYGATLK